MSNRLFATLATLLIMMLLQGCNSMKTSLASNLASHNDSTIQVQNSVRFMFLNIELLDTSTGEVRVNGAINKISDGPLRFEWDDGTFTDGFFPQTHTYLDPSQNYNIRVSASFQDGTAESQTIEAKFVTRKLDPNGAGRHVIFRGFPDDYFEDTYPNISGIELIRIVDIQFDLLRNFHPSYNGKTIIFVYGGNCGGAYAEASKSQITLCDGFRSRNNPQGIFPWQVFVHEMSHIMFGASDRALFQWIFLYSAYLDEHQAEVSPQFVFEEMQARAAEFQLSSETVDSLRIGNDLNRSIQNNAYDTYVARGKPFDIIQTSRPEGPTITGQATSHAMFRISNGQSIANFGRFLTDAYASRWMSGQPSPVQIGNYVAAAWSAALGRDLRNDFRDLNYPIDNNLFASYATSMGLNVSANPPQNGAGYLGCFTDDGNRALKTYFGSGYTIETCKAAAVSVGLVYSAVQYGGHCFGGSELGYQQVSDDQCNMPCANDPTEICGGPWRNSIYSSGFVPPPPVPTLISPVGASASNSYPGFPSSFAIDLNIASSWNAGGFAPQFLEIDLGADYQVSEIKLRVNQYPNGDTSHEVRGRPSNSQSYVLLNSIDKFTSQGEVLSVSSNSNVAVRYLRINTSKSPSWVSWREIEVFGSR